MVKITKNSKDPKPPSIHIGVKTLKNPKRTNHFQFGKESRPYKNIR